MSEIEWGIGVDIGGTKIDVACVDSNGKIVERKKFPSQVENGADVIQGNIVSAIRALQETTGKKAKAIGIGMAGQIHAKTGTVMFAPNLGWRNIPLQNNLRTALNQPVVVTNDVRAATWGEWVHGSGKGCDDLVCLFIGTGIGGGIVSGGHLLTGVNNCAGELGHTTLLLGGPECACGNRGCLEALAGGWAVAQHTKALITENPERGATILKLANDHVEEIKASHILDAAKEGDIFAKQIVEQMIAAITGGCISFVNAFNPRRLILGGGLGNALPNLVERVEKGVKQQALPASTENLEVVQVHLLNDAGVIGAAALALREG